MIDSVAFVTTRDKWLRSVRNGIAVVALAVTAILVAQELLWRDASKTFVSPYKASAYWVSYAGGFVRRGLVGEILTLLAGGSPTRVETTWLAAGLLVAATGSLVLLVSAIARKVQRRDERLFAIAVVAASPFTFSLLIQEIGRLDSVGVVVMAAVVMVARGGETSTINRLVAAVAMSVLVVVATACEELLFAFVAPLAVLGLWRLGWISGKAWAWKAPVVVVPGAVLAVMSVLLRPSKAWLVATINAANAAGISVDVSHENSISTLGQSTLQGLEFTRGMSGWTVVSCLMLFGGCYLLATVMIGYLTQLGRVAGVIIATFGMAALLLSAIGNDYGRWWALAFVAVLAGFAMLPTPGAASISIVGPASGPGFTALVFACALLAFSVRLQLVNVWPDWDPGADTAFSIDRLAQLDPQWH